MASIWKSFKNMVGEDGKMGSKAQKHPDVLIDYPQHGERIVSSNYTFRIGARTAGPVEISIDGNEWLPCRQAGDHWWYDWAGYRPGKHKAVARIQSQSGPTATSETRRFLVELP
jgi:hypothetical protein